MLSKIINLFKKKPVEETHYGNLVWKVNPYFVEKELNESYWYSLSNTTPEMLVSMHSVPCTWRLHINYCLNSSRVDFALKSLENYSRCLSNYGADCSILDELRNEVKQSEQYKKLLLKERLKRMEKDFV